MFYACIFFFFFVYFILYFLLYFLSNQSFMLQQMLLTIIFYFKVGYLSHAMALIYQHS